MFPTKRVAVIGGGFSGLSAIKALKEENIEPVCFEKTSNPGGTWFYREEALEGLPSIMPTTVLNHSKEMGAYSNFPPKEHYANYMRHSDLYQYFREVGEAFDCFRHMVFSREVVGVHRTDDHERTGKWLVTVRNTDNEEETSESFDGVIVCLGHITHPKRVDFPGMEKFRGQIIHTHSLKRVDAFRGQKVCVVGIGCSALDAAVECSNVTKQVYLSTRSGAWIFPRVGPGGVPMDSILLRRYISFFQSILPISLSSKFVEVCFLNQKFNHELYNLTPQYHVLCKDPSVNDFLSSKLLSGSVMLKDNIKYFTENGIVFEGESDVTEVDTVIMATGYQWKFPFLEDNIITTENNQRADLYKCVWPINLEHPTMALIGFILPFGPGFPLGELQCRWVAQVFAGKLKLPDKDVMMKRSIRMHEKNLKRFRPGDKMSLRVDYIPYMNDIASQFGAKPNLLRMLITDPVLFKACVFGPCVPYQYRLQGPHPWKGAREAILNVGKRMQIPLQGNLANTKSSKNKDRFNFVAKYIFNMFLMSLLVYWKDSSMKYYIPVVLLPNYTSWRSYLLKFMIGMLFLPLFISMNDIFFSHFTTMLVPLIVAGASSI